MTLFRFRRTIRLRFSPFLPITSTNTFPLPLTCEIAAISYVYHGFIVGTLRCICGIHTKWMVVHVIYQVSIYRLFSRTLHIVFTNVTVMSFPTEHSGRHNPQFSGIVQQSTADFESCLRLPFINLGRNSLTEITVAMLPLALNRFCTADLTETPNRTDGSEPLVTSLAYNEQLHLPNSKELGHCNKKLPSRDRFKHCMSRLLAPNDFSLNNTHQA